MVDLLGVFLLFTGITAVGLLQCQHLIPALNAWAAWAKYKTTCPIATQFPGHGCMNDLQPNVTLIRKLRGSLMCLSNFIEMLSMGVCTTRQWQTSGQLVQEFNVCTVVTGSLQSVKLNSCHHIMYTTWVVI